jgi:hypothetical protein
VSRRLLRCEGRFGGFLACLFASTCRSPGHLRPAGATPRQGLPHRSRTHRARPGLRIFGVGFQTSRVTGRTSTPWSPSPLSADRPAWRRDCTGPRHRDAAGLLIPGNSGGGCRSLGVKAPPRRTRRERPRLARQRRQTQSSTRSRWNLVCSADPLARTASPTSTALYAVAMEA